MSTHSEYLKNTKEVLALTKKAKNARSIEEQKKYAAKAKKLYGDLINQLQTQNINPAKQEIAILETTIEIRTRQYNDEKRTREPLDSTDLAILTNDPNFGSKGTQTYQKQLQGYKDRIKTANEQIAKYKKIVEYELTISKSGIRPPKKEDNGKGGPTVTDQGNASFSTDWKYNAPMVKSAYFGGFKGVSESLVGLTNEGNFVDAGKYQDAMNAWTNITGGRGTIQMDRKFVNTLANSQNNTVALDPQMYGFKFLYNPKEVAMSWNQLMAMDPFYESTGQDAYTTVSAQLVASTVELTILLNRIGDFAYINEMGYNAGFGKNSDLEDAAIRRLRQDTGTLVDNPYPDDVDVEEVKEIYKKGTMYDIEYLFKTINGPHATFISQLNGKTADRGWIRPTFVELHLGAGLRYRVRVVELSVTHSIFNSRMVPILSSVKMTLGRFNDGPQTYSESHPSYGANNLPLYQPGGTKLP